MNSPRYSFEIDRLILDGLDLTPLQVEQLRQELILSLSTRLIDTDPLPESMRAEHVTLPPLEPHETRHTGRLASSLSERIAGMLSSARQEVKRA